MLEKLKNNFVDTNAMETNTNQRFDKVTKRTICSFGAMIFGILFGWVMFPPLLKLLLSHEMSLSKGTDMREMWSKLPFALDFKLYVFNVTNPDEILKGGKPRVQEIGPFFYEEWKEKVNIEDIEEEDAILYNRKDTFLFIQEKSGPGLTGNEIVTIPHPILVATAVIVAIEKPTMINMAAKAIEGIYDSPKTFFIQAKVADILFDGLIINCDHTDFAPKAVCTVMKKNKNFKVEGNNIRFSLFGLRNATVEAAKFKVLRGKKNIMDVGKVIEFDGKPTQKIWGGPKCNDFNGTDGTIFPPFLTPQDELLSFSPEICRSLGAWYEKETSYHGMPTNRYVANLGDLINEPDHHCFCDTPTTCPKRGLMDLRKCLEGPFIASMPHFLDTDMTVQAGVVGLNPDVDKHGISIDFEPISGTPLQAKKRIQANIQLLQIDKINLFKETHADQLIPLFWVEEGLALTKKFSNLLKYQLFLAMKTVSVIKWTLTIGGLFGTIAGLLIKYKSRIMKFAVRPAPETLPTSANSNASEHALNGVSNPQKFGINTIQTTQEDDKI